MGSYSDQEASEILSYCILCYYVIFSEIKNGAMTQWLPFQSVSWIAESSEIALIEGKHFTSSQFSPVS